MASLTGSSIASSYNQLLSLPSGGLNSTTLVSITDGDTSTAVGFQVSTNALSMTGTNQLQFGDTGTYIHQSADGVLDLVSDTTLELNGGAGSMKIDANSRISLSNNDAGTGGEDSTSGNTIFGYLAGAAIDSDVKNNSLFGHKSGNAINAGDNNVAVGTNSLDANDAGNGHTALGYNSLSAQAGATDGTTAIGYKALHQNNYGGSYELSVAVGYEAGDNQTSGFYNTFLGASTTGNDATATNQIVIGYHAAGIDDNYAVIGNENITRLYAADDGGATFYGAGQSWSDKRIKENVKDIGLGLDFIKKLTPIQFTKKQPKNYESSLKSKLQLAREVSNKKSLRVLDDTEVSRKRAGFLAQDVLSIMKEFGFDENNAIVQIDEKTTQHSMDYSSMVVPLVKAVQELSAKVEELEAKVK
tara:strand:- start:290 stop:1534 length:1245 start_codon:yes stop_codon:yes gene_type:complete